MPSSCARGRTAHRRRARQRARLDRKPVTGQCPGFGRPREMKLLSHLSPEGNELPEPADAPRVALGFAAWHETLAGEGDPGTTPPWSATPVGRRLLRVIFGNSPFLSGLAVREHAFLTRIVEEGADPLFAEIAATVEIAEDFGEDTTALMRRL